MAKTTIAIMYDFDKTLSENDMQNYTFIQNLGMNPPDFWTEVGEIVKEYKMDKILAYMYLMVKKCQEKSIPLTKEYLMKCGKAIKLHKGVSTFFSRINEYAKKHDAVVEHYIISSGISDIIRGTTVAKYFKEIYGCEFLYNPYGVAIWPSLTINFTQKTQFIFRMSKGVLDIRDDENLNKKSDTKKIPYENMIYIGDGLTDIPCMKLIREKGGHSIAIYPPKDKNKVSQLVKDKRINSVCAADYSKESALDKTVKLMIEKIVVMRHLKEKEAEQYKSFEDLLNDNKD